MSVPDIINGRYEVVGTIGAGGMGVLYRARDPWIGGRIVALKLLKEGLDDDEIRTRFKQEASAAGMLEHENIVRIFDVGEHDGQPFIAMEYVDGDTVASLIRERVPIPLLKKLEWVEQLCDGLAYAHAHGIVHRDIKPLNLIVERRRQRLKVLDFGIAKVANAGITTAGIMIGTTNYMSPEQMRGDTIDHRSDIFSVGATVFELFAGTRAFPGAISDGLMGRIMVQPAPSLIALVPDLPPEIDGMVAHALEKDPARRYGDLVQMRDEVRVLRHRLKGAEETATATGIGGDRGEGGHTGLGATATGPARTALSPLPGPITLPGAPPPLPGPPTGQGAVPTVTARAPGGPPTVGSPPAAPAIPSPLLPAPPPPTAAAPSPPVAAAGTPGGSRNVIVFLAVLAVATIALAAALWWLVPWGALLRSWRGQTPAPAVTETPAPPGPATPVVDEAAVARERAAEAAKARLAGVTISVDAQPWAEVRLVPALAEADVSALPPEVVRELAKERGPFVTPFVAEVPAGHYMASFENVTLGLSHTERITVTASGENRFRVPLPGFDADRFIGQLLRGTGR